MKERSPIHPHAPQPAAAVAWKRRRQCRPDKAIVLYNRVTGSLEHEKVCGRSLMNLVYGTCWGRRIADCLLVRRQLSQLYGWWQQHAASRRGIAPFVSSYRIDLSEACVPKGGFRSFNDFFIRRLKPQARPVNADPACLVSPADSRLQVFPLDWDKPLTIKGAEVTLTRLLGNARLDVPFEGGLCLCFRLAPVDYHRFGYPDDGVQGPVHVVPGPLHSVNPLALRHKPDILGTNQRHWCVLNSRHFGTMLYIEVGAMLVGSLVQNRPGGGPCGRGEEKGYFQFGGSTVLLLIQNGQVVVDPDVAAWSRKGIETIVRYGQRVARKPREEG